MPTKYNRFPLWPVFALLVYCAAFIAAARWDLAINQALYSPTQPFAVWMEAFGWYPAFLIVVFYALLWLILPKVQHAWWQMAAGGAVCAGGLAGILYKSIQELCKRGWVSGYLDPRSCLVLAGVALLGGLMLLAALRTPATLRPALQFWGFWGSVYTAANQAAVYSIKTLWQRTRFDDMLPTGSFDAFTPWYRPLGNGGSSMPSGHTANAAGLFILIILCDVFPCWHKRRHWVYAGIWCYIALMAFMRILIGRHFLSDTLAGSGIMALLFFALRRSRPYQKGLQKVREQLGYSL